MRYFIVVLLCFLTGCSSLKQAHHSFNTIQHLDDPEVAIVRFEQLANQLASSEDDALLEVAARSIANQVYLLNNQKDYQKAIEVSQRGVAQFEHFSTPSLRAKVVGLLNNQANAYDKLGKYSNSLTVLQHTVAIYEDDEYPTTAVLVAVAHLGQVDALIKLKDFKQAQRAWTEFNQKYMQSNRYQLLDFSGLSMGCEELDDPCTDGQEDYPLDASYFERYVEQYKNKIRLEYSAQSKRF